MSKHIVVVESPAKAKTIEKFLGKDYEVLASFGHVRDLLPKEKSVDPTQNFAMKYAIIEKNAKHVDAIAKALKKADSLLLATDPDREGEAISWHIRAIMEEKGLLSDKSVSRIVFNEITKPAILNAVAHPRDIAMPLVNAQQGRRALDYLVGFYLSPLLWKKIRRGLSAGRVQSPALRLIVEREEAIDAFKAQEYWKITANCLQKKDAFEARLTHYKGEKHHQFSIGDETYANTIVSTLTSLANKQLIVHAIDKKQRKRKPAAPFITSTLQQEAVRKLGFTARKTMTVAQKLYEGIDIGSGTVGLITYMRTDSVTLSNEFVTEVRDYIQQKFDKQHLPSTPRVYKTKSKNAQEAHEAIRPTSISRIPIEMKSHLTPEQFKLYQLIWQRTLASQMEDAILDTVAVDLFCGEPDNLFRANGTTLVFPGFLAVYEEGKDDSTDEDDKNTLPVLSIGDKINLKSIIPSQHFTEPPPRYSEATLVKALEEYDIGRPSTYASIIHTLQLREYVILDKKRFIPTDVGKIVNKFLTQHFTQYVDYQFTAKLEDTLDDIARGDLDYIPVLRHFWDPFYERVQHIDASVKRTDVTTEVLEDSPCPDCGKPLSIRLGKRGRFIGCTGYPECSYTKPLDQSEAEAEAPVVLEDRTCPLCTHPLHIKAGRYGKFIGCSHYPTCKHMEPLEKPVDTGVRCPLCFEKTILQRKSKKGRIFYSCSGYPKCKYAIWNEPVDKQCPKCAWPILTYKTTKTKGNQYLCPKEGCDYKEEAE